jgi:uncharacterized protein involved in exopolysaccharide biosynthesis
MTVHQEISGEEASLLDYLLALLRWRWLLVVGCCIFGVAGLYSALQQEPSYEATAFFMPAGALGGTDQLSALGGTTGKDWKGIRSASDIVKYYSVTLKSRALLVSLLDSSFSSPSGTSSTLRAILAPASPQDGEDSEGLLLLNLRNALHIGSAGGKVLTLSYKSEKAWLVAPVVNRLLDEHIAISSQTKDAAADIEFLESELSDVGDAIGEADARIAEARGKLLDVDQPDAQLRIETIEREADVFKSHFRDLSGELTKAKIRESQSKARSAHEIIDVLDDAETPLVPTGPGKKRTLMVFLLLGLFLSMALAFVLEFFRTARNAQKDHPFWQALRRARRDLILMALAGCVAAGCLVWYYFSRR